MRFNNLIIAYSFPHIALHANLISLKRETTNCRGFVNREGVREREREKLCAAYTLYGELTQTHTNMLRYLCRRQRTLSRTPTRKTKCALYECVCVRMYAYMSMFPRISVWDSTLQMLQLFIDIKLKFTKLETEAVQSTENVDGDIAVAVSANFRYIELTL